MLRVSCTILHGLLEIITCLDLVLCVLYMCIRVCVDFECIFLKFHYVLHLFLIYVCYVLISGLFLLFCLCGVM